MPVPTYFISVVVKVAGWLGPFLDYIYLLIKKALYKNIGNYPNFVLS